MLVSLLYMPRVGGESVREVRVNVVNSPLREGRNPGINLLLFSVSSWFIKGFLIHRSPPVCFSGTGMSDILISGYERESCTEERKTTLRNIDKQ